MNCDLYTTYYDERNSARRREMDLCLQLNQSAFARITVVAEQASPPPWFLGRWLAVKNRPTFSDLLARMRLDGFGRINVLANNDIIFPPSTVMQLMSIAADDVYCLTRWETSGQLAMELWDVAYSQDAWVFRSQPKDVAAEFWFGVPGCDNRFTHALRAAGYQVSNPSRSIHTYHLHGTSKRTVTNSDRHRVPPPYLYLEPIELGQPQPMVEALTLAERQAAFSARRRARRHRPLRRTHEPQDGRYT